MILGVFIEFFGVKIAIGLSKNHFHLILTVGFDLSQNSLYISDISYILSIYLRYFIDISLIFTDISSIFYRYFSRNSSRCACEIYSRYFAEISKFFYISLKYRRFYRFLDRLSVGKIVLVSVDIRYFGDISADISDFLFLACYIFILFPCLDCV